MATNTGFIPYRDPAAAAATVNRKSYSSIVPFANNSTGLNAAYNTPGYQPAAINQSNANAQAARDAQAAAAAEAARQAAAKQAAMINQINVGIEGIQQTGRTGLRDLSNSYSTQNRNTVQGIQSGQESINRARENTALNLRRGMSGIVNSIRQGVRSGGVQLANMNASDSGAAEALARAYARQGNQQASDVRNQAFLQNRDTDVQQKALDQQEANAVSDFQTYRQTEIDRVSTDLYNKLRVLDANASAEGLNGRVDFSLRDRLINEAIAQLNAIDQQTSSALASTNALTQDQINANAASLDAAGAAGNPFTAGTIDQSLTSNAPMAGDLPIYYRRDDRTRV